MGLPSYSNATQLVICADLITVSTPTAAVIVNPNNDYSVDSTPLMSVTGTCDTDAEYSRTEPVLVAGGDRNGSPTTTLATVAAPSASIGAGGVSSSKSRGGVGPLWVEEGTLSRSALRER